MLRIALVDDEEVIHNQIKEYLKELSIKEDVEVSTHDFYSGSELLGNYDNKEFDIILLDIEMPNMDGMETARNIRKIDENVIIIFVTNMGQFACKGYEVEALDFIVKPLDQYSFVLKMSRAISRLNIKRENKLVLKVNGGDIHIISSNSVLYVEVLGHYLIYHTKKSEYKVYATLKEAEANLNPKTFVKCNRCYIVNLAYVSEIKDDNVYMNNGDNLIISRPQKKSFINALVSYLGGN